MSFMPSTSSPWRSTAKKRLLASASPAPGVDHGPQQQGGDPASRRASAQQYDALLRQCTPVTLIAASKVPAATAAVPSMSSLKVQSRSR